MKRFLFKILMRLLEQPSYHRLEPNEVRSILITLSKEEGLERLPDFLAQCSDSYRNQYLYSGNEMFKGAVIACTQLREQILEKRKPSKKKHLVEGEEGGIIKQVY